MRKVIEWGKNIKHNLMPYKHFTKSDYIKMQAEYNVMLIPTAIIAPKVHISLFLSVTDSACNIKIFLKRLKIKFDCFDAGDLKFTNSLDKKVPKLAFSIM